MCALAVFGLFSGACLKYDSSLEFFPCQEEGWGPATPSIGSIDLDMTFHCSDHLARKLVRGPDMQ
jgi:hypothetical protein